MNPHDLMEPRLVAHHVGARGYGVSFNVPASFQRDVVHVLYEADRECVERMLRETDSPHARALPERHVFPYCLGREDGPGRLNITANAYASSVFEPNPEFLRYYCEIPIDAAIYDVTYAEMLEVLRKVDVEIRSMDRLFAQGVVPGALRPDFLSLDTQGYELEILEGARHTVADGVLGIVCEVEMLPIYAGQPLLGDILQHMTRHDFLFAGFTALFEVAPMRATVGLRGKGFPGFGDALFLRDLDKLSLDTLGVDRAYGMFLKAAFIALSFGHVEYSLDAVQRAGRLRARVTPAWLSRLDSLGYVKFLHSVATAATRQQAMYPPIHAVPDNSRQPGDTRTSWYDKHHKKALEALHGKPAAVTPPSSPGGLLRSPLARAVRRVLPDWIARPLRRMLVPDASPPSVTKVDPAVAKTSPNGTGWKPMQSYTEFEKLLDNSGFTGVMQIVQQRRLVAEHYIRALDPSMYGDGAFAHLTRD